MKMFSKVALAAALAASVGGMAIVTPAEAKKKEEAPKGPVLGKEARAAAVAAQAAQEKGDLAGMETSVAALEAVAKTNDELYFAQALRIQLEAKKITAAGGADTKSEQVLAPLLDKLLANPVTPQNEIGRYAYLRGNISFNAQQYGEAAKLYQRARESGFTADDLNLQIAKSKVEAGDIDGGLADIDTAMKAEVAAGRKPPEAWYRYVIPRLYKANRSEQVVDWTRRWLAAYGNSKNWRDAIYTFGFQGSGAKRLDRRQRMDLFRLMRATKSLGDLATYLEYAQACNDSGLQQETVKVVAEGQATGVIPAGNADATLLVKDAKTGIALDKPLATQEKAATASADGALSAQTGDAFFGAGDYAKAATLYASALQKGGAKVNADEVNTHLGIALTMTGDKAGAKAAFDAVKTAPRTDIARLWEAYVESPPVA